jgi:hypothetical protein
MAQQSSREFTSADPMKGEEDARIQERGNQHIEHFALGVDGSPKIDHAAIDFEIDLIEMPDGVGLWSAFAQVRCDLRPKMVHPAPNGLVRDHDATFRR